MATYEEIYGKRVKEFDSDPTLDSSYEGQVWYNSATGTLKSVVSFAAAVSAQAMPTGTRAYGSIGATQSAFMVACGANPGTNYSANVYEYNGSGWVTETSASNTRDQAPRGSLGTTTAGLVFGGLGPSIVRATTELWNGSSWSESGDLSDSRGGGESFGAQTACVTTGGYNDFSPPYWTNATEEFNGSSWTAGTATPINTINGCGVGTLTAGIIIGQQEQPGNSYPSKATVTQTRNYDGTSWTNGGVINMATNVASVAGTSSSCRKAGGASPAPASYTNTEEWDNTSWTTGPSLVSDLSNGGGAGTSTAAVYAGGQTPPGNLTTVQEVNKSINTITAAAWASGGNLNTARSQGTGAGTMTAGWVVGGQEPSLSNKTEEYDGTSWTAVNNLGMSSRLLCGAGPQTSAFATGGFIPGPSVTNAVYNYDGTDWTSGAAQPVGTYGQGSLGTQTAGLAFGGSAPTTSNHLTTSYEYDGEGWTASPGGLNQGRHYIAGSGTQTAGLAAGGDKGPAKSDNTEEYNGSSWTAGATMPDVRRGAGLSGPQTAALLFGGGGDPGARTTTFGYDGTSWSTRPSISTSRRLIEGGSKDGSNTSAWMAGGQLESPGAVSALTEEFDGGTETVTAKTLTTS